MGRLSAPMWELSEALKVIRALQVPIKGLGFHACFAGGVLNTGGSEKDLDIVFVPLWNDKQPPVEPLLAYLHVALGAEEDVREGDQPISHDPNPFTPYRHQEAIYDNGKRIDIFIV